MKPISDCAACVWITIHALIWAVLIAGLMLVVPRCEAIFRDFGVDLPTGTLAVVRASHVVNRVPIVLFPIFIVGLGIDYVAMKKLSWAGVWKWLMIVFPLIVILPAALSIGQVWLTLDFKLSG